MTGAGAVPRAGFFLLAAITQIILGCSGQSYGYGNGGAMAAGYGALNSGAWGPMNSGPLSYGLGYYNYMPAFGYGQDLTFLGYGYGFGYGLPQRIPGPPSLQAPPPPPPPPPPSPPPSTALLSSQQLANLNENTNTNININNDMGALRHHRILDLLRRRMAFP